MSNIESAVSFLQLIVDGKIDKAYEDYVAPAMQHHNPGFAGDAPSLRKGMKENHMDYPNKLLEIQHTISDSDMVAVHSWLRMNKEDRGSAVVHLFRFKNGKIVEMWSIGQRVPEEFLNENGMF